MKYFSGFSLFGEEVYFKEWLCESEFCVVGFSYGAQQAFEYVYASKERIDRLLLLSPAFFQTKKPSFVRTQLRYFESDPSGYAAQFLKNVSFPSKSDLSDYLKTGSRAELESLLAYQWDANKIKKVLQRGTIIEVFLAEEDKIIQVNEAYAFFSPLTICYWFKNRGHLLL